MLCWFIVIVFCFKQLAAAEQAGSAPRDKCDIPTVFNLLKASTDHELPSDVQEHIIRDVVAHSRPWIQVSFIPTRNDEHPAPLHGVMGYNAAGTILFRSMQKNRPYFKMTMIEDDIEQSFSMRIWEGLRYASLLAFNIPTKTFICSVYGGKDPQTLVDQTVLIAEHCLLRHRTVAKNFKSIVVSPDGQQAALALHGKIKFWNMVHNTLSPSIHDNPLTPIAYSTNGLSCAYARSQLAYDEIIIIHAQTHEVRAQIALPDSFMSKCLRFNNAGNKIAIVGWNKQERQWYLLLADIDGQRVTKTIHVFDEKHQHDAPIMLSYNHDDTEIALLVDQEMKIINVEQSALLMHTIPQQAVRSFAYSPVQHQLAISTDHGIEMLEPILHSCEIPFINLNQFLLLMMLHAYSEPNRMNAGLKAQLCFKKAGLSQYTFFALFDSFPDTMKERMINQFNITRPHQPQQHVHQPSCIKNLL